MKKIFALFALAILCCASFAQRVPEGKYKIICQSTIAAPPNYYLTIFDKDISGNSNGINENGASLRIYSGGEDDSHKQTFEVEYVNETYFKIRAVHSKRILDINSGVATLGEKIHQWTDESVDNRLWKVANIGEGEGEERSFLIYSKKKTASTYSPANTELNITVSSTLGGWNNGTPIVLSNGTNAPARFHFIPASGDQYIPDGNYRIVSAADGKQNFDVWDSGDGNDAVKMMTYNKTQRNNGHVWTFKHVGNGFYTIASSRGDKGLLNVSGDAWEGKPNIQTWSGTVNAGSRWVIRYEENGGYYYLMNEHGRVLDVDGGSNNIADNCRLQGYRPNCDPGQRWYLLPIDNHTLPDGDYRIVSGLNNGYQMEVKGDGEGNTDDGNVRIQPKSTANNQKWHVTYDESEGLYVIKSTLPGGRLLDLNGAPYTIGSSAPNITTWGTDVSDHKRWSIIQADDRYYIANTYGLFADIDGGSLAEGASLNIQGWHPNRTAAQEWYFAPVNCRQALRDGEYRIVPLSNTNLTLTVDGDGSADGQKVKLQTWNATNAQKWTVHHEGDGIFTLQSKLSDARYFNLNGGKYTGSADIEIYWKGTDEASKWFIKDNGDFFYVINHNGRVLDLENGSIAADTQAKGMGADITRESQKWVLIPVDGEQVIPNGQYRIASTAKFAGNKLTSGVRVSSGDDAKLHEFGNITEDKWNVTYLQDGFYKITSQKAGNAELYMQKGEYLNEPSVKTYGTASPAEAKWIIKKTDDGVFSIINSRVGHYLNLANGQTADDTDINGKQNVNGDAQKWVFVPVSGQVLPNGKYRIVSAQNPDLSLAVSNTNNGALVQLKQKSNDDKQKWNITYDNTSGNYKISSILNERMLDVADAGYKNDLSINGWSGDLSPNRQWKIADARFGKFYIAHINGRYLDAANGSIAANQNAKGRQQSMQESQEWVFIPVNGEQTICDGIYNIITTCKAQDGSDMKFAIDDTGGSVPTEGKGVHMWESSKHFENQEWEVKYVAGEGYYNIKTMKNGNFMLNVPKTADNYKSYPSINQTTQNVPGTHWYIKDAGNGSHYAVNENGYFLDLRSGSENAKKGGQVGGWGGNSGDPQKWKFEIESIPVDITDLNDGQRYSSLYCGEHNLVVPTGIEALTYTDDPQSPTVTHHLTYSDDGNKVIPKKTGVILHSKESFNKGEKKRYYFNVTEQEGVKNEDNILTGVDKADDIVQAENGGIIYRLYNGSRGVGFYIPKKRTDIQSYDGEWLKPGAHKAYFILNYNSSIAPTFLSLEDEEETDIQALPEATNYKLQTTDEIYSLSGQRLQKMQRGINIVGGKKIVIK